MGRLSQSRKVALDVLIYAREHKEFPCGIVHTMCDKQNLSDADKSFCVKLVRGVSGHEVCLDYVLKQFLKSKISPAVRDALRISAYELLYLRKDCHASVDQGVELVKSVAKSAAGLANAVLRKVATQSLPDDVALRCGFSEELRTYIYEIYDENQAEAFFQLCDCEPQLQYVANHLKHKTDDLEVRDCIVELAKKGDVIIADVSAQAIAREVALACVEKKAISLLEVGAGRGTKTALIESFLAEKEFKLKTHDCLDCSKMRLDELSKKAKLCNFCVHNLICEDATQANLINKYDIVFADSPCTGLGTLRRHPEIKNRVTRYDIKKASELSLEIIKNISKAVAKGGLLFYSTCTITHEENEDVVEKFLSSDEGANFEFKRVVRQPILTESCDAHYCVCLKCKM